MVADSKLLPEWAPPVKRVNSVIGLRHGPEKPDEDLRHRPEPGDPKYGRAAFYGYAHPPVEGLPGRNVSPDAARWDPDMGLYNLDNDHVDDALEFARSVFHHACVVCDWDPALLGSAEGSPAPVR